MMVFHDLHNGHVNFEQWLGQVDPRRPVHCAALCRVQENQKRPHENHFVTRM
jgi:hypothetical protein